MPIFYQEGTENVPDKAEGADGMYRFKRFTDKANTALNLAVDAARELGHTYIGTEHILLGLLREGTGVAAAVLAGRGITTMRYAEKILESEAGGSYSMLTPEDLTPRAKAAMETALSDAAALFWLPFKSQYAFSRSAMACFSVSFISVEIKY